MEIEDRTSIDDDTVEESIVRLVALVDGLAGAPYHCSCGRYFRVGITDELRAVVDTIKRAIKERTGEELVAETSRFAFLEVD
jgi:hypothetical protein